MFLLPMLSKINKQAWIYGTVCRDGSFSPMLILNSLTVFLAYASLYNPSARYKEESSGFWHNHIAIKANVLFHKYFQLKCFNSPVLLMA